MKHSGLRNIVKWIKDKISDNLKKRDKILLEIIKSTIEIQNFNLKKEHIQRLGRIIMNENIPKHCMILADLVLYAIGYNTSFWRFIKAESNENDIKNYSKNFQKDQAAKDSERFLSTESIHSKQPKTVNNLRKKKLTTIYNKLNTIFILSKNISLDNMSKLSFPSTPNEYKKLNEKVKYKKQDKNKRILPNKISKKEK